MSEEKRNNVNREVGTSLIHSSTEVNVIESVPDPISTTNQDNTDGD